MASHNDEAYPAGYKPTFYTKVPKTLHEKYIEAWYNFSGSKLTKERAQTLANVDWKASSDDEKHNLIKRHVRAIRKRKNTLFSFGVYKKEKTDATAESAITDTAEVEVMVTETMPSGSGLSKSTSTHKYVETANASTGRKDKDSYSRSHQYSFIDIFLASLDENCRQLLDDPSIQLQDSKIVMEALMSVSKVYNEVHPLLVSYEEGKQRGKETELSKTLSEIKNKRNELKVQILEALSVKIDPVLGLSILKANAERKELLLKEIAINCLSFKSMINDKGVKRSLQRRVAQINKINDVRSVSEKTILICKNNSKLTWDEAFSNLVGEVNSYDMDIYNVGILIQNSAIIHVKDHLSKIKNSSKETKKFIHSLLTAFPLLYLKNAKGEEFIVNLHQTSNDGDELSKLIYESDEQNAPSTKSASIPPKVSQYKHGQKSIVEKFPTIPDVATEFIKRNGFKAQEKRRDDDFVSCGVSVDEVRQHLLKTIPGLVEHGLCINTVRYLFKAVNKSRSSSKRYTGLVDCRVPQKDNSGRESDENSHYLHSRVNMRLEQAFLFEDEHIVFSADAMNKILVGDVLCVSRYHQIRRLFMVEDNVRVKDHDFPQGYKIIPCGKMPLLKPGVYLHDIFGEAVDAQMNNDERQADLYEHDNIGEDAGYDTDGCMNDETGQEERQNNSEDKGNPIPRSSADLRTDKLGRAHVKFPRTGPVLVYNRNGQFHSQTMEAHANDFLPLLSSAVKAGRSCIVMVVDNGPDMNPTNYVNEYNLGNLWIDSGADMLLVTSYAAGQSAYNMIEHAWSPLSNRLTSVKLPAVLPKTTK